MSNSTAVAAPAQAPLKSPARASSPVGALVVPKVPASVNFSWIGIVGILGASLALAIISLVCLWYKKRAYKQALIDQSKEFFAAKRKTGKRKDHWSEEPEESEERSKRGKLILADYEKVLGVTRFSEDFDGDRKLSGVLSEQENIPVSARDKHVVGSFKESSKHHVGFNWNLGENLVDEVFYKGEGGSQIMGVRYSPTDFENFQEIFTRVSSTTSVPKKRSESESASLLGAFSGDHCTIAVESSPPKGVTNIKSKWTLRTFSLPVYRHSYAASSLGGRQDTSVGEKGDTLSKQECESPNKFTGNLAHSPTSLPSSPSAHSYSPRAAFGRITSWKQKPSRLGSLNNGALIHNSTFIVPPSTPPPPLPLPVSVEFRESCKTLRGAVKLGAEPKWSIASYCPAFAPPPPLPVPIQPPSLTPTEGFKENEARTVPPPPPPPPPPPFPTLPCRKFPQPPSPPPLPTLPKTTLPPSPPRSDGDKSKDTPSPPLPTLPCTSSTSPASPPLSGDHASRPKLAPLILPGRADLGDAGNGGEDFRPPGRRHQKMRPLHWEKLKPESRSTMVWDTISDSMELDVEMIENLFGVTTRSASESEVMMKRSSNVTAISEKTEILDPKKAHNIAIQLRARGLARAKVCDALLEGDGLDQENLELLVKMTPTEEELTRFQEYQGDLTLLGPADRFVQGLLQIPSAFERLQAMLFRASYQEELHQIQETITTLEMACKELKGSRTFIKLLEAVLKTGNRLNTGTFRGDAKAFKLDTLLKLADVKGVDGKTTLLHFVIQEIMKAEGARAARLAGFYNDGALSTPTSTRSSPSSPLSHFMETEFEEITNTGTNTCSDLDDFRRVGMDVVRSIPVELGHVRKAGALDMLALRVAVSRLQSGLQDMKTTLEKLLQPDNSETRSSTTYELTDDVFREKMTVFVEDAAAQVSAVQSDLELVLASVKDISVYFYGEADTAKSTQPALKVFMVMREFLAMLEQACKDVMKATAGLVTDSSHSSSRPPSRPRSLVTQSK